MMLKFLPSEPFLMILLRSRILATFTTSLIGLEFTCVPTGMAITQHKYVQDLLMEFQCTGLPDPRTPLASSPKLTIVSGAALSDLISYRRLIGKLNFLTHTRPDICFVIQHLSQFLSRPTDLHWDAAIHVLKYISTAPSKGALFLGSRKSNKPFPYPLLKQSTGPCVASQQNWHGSLDF